MNIWLVGGAVRDQLIRIVPKDLDYVVQSSYVEMIQFLKEKGCTIIHEKPDFVTCKVKFPNSSGVVDVACCRAEDNYDGRKPSLVTTATLEEDLLRRDFTVNALAQKLDDNFNLTDEIIDVTGGLIDLENKVLKFVGDPTKRLKEDGLRWLRGIRFQVTRNLVPTLESEKALQSIINPINSKISTERIREELYKCFKHDNSKTLDFLARYPKHWERPDLWFMPTTKE